LSTLKLSLVGFGSRLVATGLTVVTTLLLARFLGPEPTGQYFLFLRVVTLLAVLADLGFAQSTNVFAGHGESIGQIHGIIARFSSAMSGALLLFFFLFLTLFGAVLLPNFASRLQIAAFVCVPLLVYSNLWNYLMIGLGRIWTMNIVQMTAAAVSLLGVVVAVVGFSKGLDAAIAIYSAVLFFQVTAMAILAVRLGNRFHSDHRPGLFREMWRFGLRGLGNAVSTILWPRIPVFVLNVFSGATAVGIFSVGQQLVEKLLLPVQATQEAIYRRMAQAETAQASTSMNRYIRISAWSMLIFFGGAALVLPLVVVAVLGNQYRATVPIILVLLPGTLLMCAGVLLSAFFLVQLKRPGLLSMLAMANVALTTVFSVVLVPRYGALGAAIAVSLTQVLGTIVIIAFYMRATGARAADVLFISGRDREVFVQQLRQIMWVKRAEQ